MNQYGFRSSLEGDIHSGSDWKPYDSWTYEKKQRYERACEAYFLSQYEKRIAHLKTYGAANHEALTNEPFTPYPLDAIIPLQELPNYEFLSFLLNDSDLYLSLLPRPPSSDFVSQQDHLWHYLWEAFGVHPHELTKIYKLWGVFSKAAHLIDVQEAVDRRLYLEHPSGYSFVQLQKHLLRLIDQNVPESMELRHINFRMEQFRNDLMNSEQGKPISLHGMIKSVDFGSPLCQNSHRKPSWANDPPNDYWTSDIFEQSFSYGRPWVHKVFLG